MKLPPGYIQEAGREVSSAFISAYDNAVARVLEHPKIGTISAGGTRKLVFRKFSYSLVYRLFPDEIVIIAIAHHSRRPTYWAKRR